jgi:hypothetical protein
VSTPVTMPMAGNPGGDGDSPDSVASGGGGASHSGTSGGARDVGAYVAAVRAQLDDLKPDEIEELTGGLEADLADALRNERSAPVAMFGAPADYAAELRSAAGLPPRPVRGGRGAPFTDLSALAVGLRGGRDAALAPLRSQRWWPDLRDFVVTLRPAWWLLRGYIAYQFAANLLTDVRHVLPYSWPTWLALVVLVVASVELGRRGWARRGGWQRAAVAVGNLFALALILITLGLPNAGFETTKSTTRTILEPVPPAEGLYNAGYEVVNVFPYDKNGRPLSDVQLFDDRGQPMAPLDPSYRGHDDEEIKLVPPVTADGKPRPNVFPLREQIIDPGTDPDTGDSKPWPTNGGLRNAALPNPTQQAIIPITVPKASAAATPSPTPTSTP